MKILFVTPYYFPELKFGGPPKRLHAFARALSPRGYEVNVATFQSAVPSRKTVERYDEIAVQHLPWRGRFPYVLPRSLGRIKSLVRSVDVVHLFGLYNLICPLAAWCATRSRKPFVLEPMGMFVPRVRSVTAKRLYNATLTKWMAARAGAVVATSPLEANELNHLGSGANIVVRRNGIDLEEFESLPDRHVMRSRWGVLPAEQLVLYLGRISAKKNLIDLVTAFEQTKQPDSKLVICGPVSEPRYFEELKRSIASSSIVNNIRTEGAIYGDDLKAALAAADLFVLPSLNENFGNAAAEAVAAGAPVLLTETCGIAPLIHKRAGLAVPLGVGSLAEGLRLMLKPQVRDQMSARREEVKRQLSWEEPIAQTIELYERIVEKVESRI